ncbi:MAG: hypothetical protein KAI38_10070, partial [Candidatus Latescibacteria bacterium]|nr:hypothetical protein [Candidatus Latescibacterota bacterium]
ANGLWSFLFLFAEFFSVRSHSPMALFSRHHLLGNTVQIKSVSLGEQPPAGFANLREVWWFLSCDL